MKRIQLIFLGLATVLGFVVMLTGANFAEQQSKTYVFTLSDPTPTPDLGNWVSAPQSKGGWTWPGGTPESLRFHLEDWFHALNTSGMSFQEMKQTHDSIHDEIGPVSFDNEGNAHGPGIGFVPYNFGGAPKTSQVTYTSGGSNGGYRSYGNGSTGGRFNSFNSPMPRFGNGSQGGGFRLFNGPMGNGSQGGRFNAPPPRIFPRLQQGFCPDC